MRFTRKQKPDCPIVSTTPSSLQGKRYLSVAPKPLYDLSWTPQRSLQQDLLIVLAEALASQQKGGADESL